MSNLALIPNKEEWAIIDSICKSAADSKYFQALGGYAGAVCVVLYGREIGVSPMIALMNFQNVQGKLTMSAELMHSLILQAGHKIEIRQLDDNGCIIWGKRKDNGAEYIATYGPSDAKRANLFKQGGSYDKNPTDMYFARAISRMKRRLTPDIATKAYVFGEIEEEPEKEDKKTLEVKTVPFPVPRIEAEPKVIEYIQETEIAILADMLFERDDLRTKILERMQISALSEIPKAKLEPIVSYIQKELAKEPPKEDATKAIDNV